MKSWIGCVLGCEFPKLYCFIIFVHLWAVFKNISETKSLSSAMWILQLYSGIAIFWPALWSLGLSWHIGFHCLTDGDKTCHWFDTRWQPPDKLDHLLTKSWLGGTWNLCCCDRVADESNDIPGRRMTWRQHAGTQPICQWGLGPSYLAQPPSSPKLAEFPNTLLRRQRTVRRSPSHPPDLARALSRPWVPRLVIP